MRSVTLDRSAVRVAGLATVPVQVTVRAAKSGATATDDTIYVLLTRTAGKAPGPDAPGSRLVELKRTAGTPSDGTYIGTTPIPSTMNGTFTVTRAYAWTSDIGESDPVAVAGPSLIVAGSHIPKLTVTNSPMPVPIRASSYRFEGRLVDRDTGKGFGKPVTLATGLDSVCVESFPSERATTDNAGYFSIRRSGSSAQWLHCAVISPTDDWSQEIASVGYWVQVRPWVSAKPAKTRAKAGAAVRITGSVGGAPANCRVVLQRRDASGWRKEASAGIRQSGRYTLVAHPPRSGKISYNVTFPRCGTFWPASSSTFVVRATR